MRLGAVPPWGESMPPPVYAAAARDGEGERCDSSRAELDGGFDGGRKPISNELAGPFEASIRDSSMAKRSADCAAIIIPASPFVAPWDESSPLSLWRGGASLARAAK